MNNLARAGRLTSTYIVVAAAVVTILFPYLWVFLSSFKPALETYAVPPTLLPVAPTLDNYRAAFGLVREDAAGGSLLPQAFRNSLLTASAATVLVMLLAILAGYAFGRIKFPFRTGLLLLILGLRMVPAIVLIVPIYILVQRLSLLNTPWALILVYSAFQTPFAVWLLSVFLQEIAQDLEDAARVDGCNRLQVLVRVIGPLAVPQIAVVAIFVFLGCWNDFLFALILTSTEAAKTMPVALSELQSAYQILWGVMTAGAIIHTLPAILVVLFAQRYVISGMTLGAVKG